MRIVMNIVKTAVLDPLLRMQLEIWTLLDKLYRGSWIPRYASEWRVLSAPPPSSFFFSPFRKIEMLISLNKKTPTSSSELPFLLPYNKLHFLLHMICLICKFLPPSYIFFWDRISYTFHGLLSWASFFFFLLSATLRGHAPLLPADLLIFRGELWLWELMILHNELNLSCVCVCVCYNKLNI